MAMKHAPAARSIQCCAWPNRRITGGEDIRSDTSVYRTAEASMTSPTISAMSQAGVWSVTTGANTDAKRAMALGL